jgi:uncharacterized membrane protein YdjX (TVP38/TMEM64 family)
MNKLNKDKIKTIVFIAVAIGLPLWAYLSGMDKHFTRDKIKHFVESYETLAPLVYITGMTLLPIIGVPRLILTAVGGALFQLLWGTVYAMIGSTTAGVLGYYLAYYSTADYFEATTNNKQNKLISMLDFTKRNNFWLIFLARICPLTHYEAINYLCGTSKIPFKSFFWSTFFGIIPGTFVYVMMGDAIMEISDKHGILNLITDMTVGGKFGELIVDKDVKMLMWVLILLAIFLAGTLAGFYYIIKGEKKENAAKATDTAVSA